MEQPQVEQPKVEQPQVGKPKSNLNTRAVKERLEQLGRWAEFQRRVADASVKWRGKIAKYHIRELVLIDMFSGDSSGTNAAEIARLGRRQKLFARMAQAAQSRRASAGQVVYWVACNLCLPLREIDFAKIPDPAAVMLLSFAVDNREEFVKTHYAKLIPARSNVKHEGIAGEPGEDDAASGALDGLDAELGAQGRADAALSSGPEGSGPEPGVPSSGVGTGPE